MNKKAKSRLIVVGGIIVIAMLVIIAVAGSGGSAASLSIGDVLGGGYDGKKVQVSGSVVADSLTNDGAAATFAIADENDPSQELTVSYEGALPATFGSGVVAICTGTVDGADNLACTDLVTKCPAKYESAEGSLTVKGLTDQADSLTGEQTKVCGYVSGEINTADAPYRFTLESQGAQINVVWDGGLDEAVTDGTAVVVSGALQADGTFKASEQPAIDEAVTQA